jgi:S1-C subfamily serine protease
MIKCPNCGYERKKGDEIIGAAECPKCGIIYNKWKPAADLEKKVLSIKTPEPVSPDQPLTNKKNIERKLIIAVGIVALIVLVNSLFIPQIIKYFKQDKNETSNPQLPQVYNERENRQNNMPNNNIQEAAQVPILQTAELSLTEIVRKIRNSVVVVKTPSGIGSGFFINSRGYIVTNKHVLADAGNAEIKTVTGNVYKIKSIVFEDYDGDLVIAASDAPGSESVPVILSSNLPEVGEKIVVIGNPMGLEQTVSDGIVSAIRSSQQAIKFIQITAPVSPGNSGGPLLNMQGEVIGVATFQYRQGQNLNFCVAAERVIGLQSGTLLQAGQSSGDEFNSPQRRDVYCYADSDGKVFFVDWQTGLHVSRPDGSLDRAKFEKWALDQVGGNPDYINPEKEAQSALDQKREELFKSIFPNRSMSDSNLNAAEKEALERRYNRFYIENYNNAMSRRNGAIRKYQSMIWQFDKFNNSRRY